MFRKATPRRARGFRTNASRRVGSLVGGLALVLGLLVAAPSSVSAGPMPTLSVDDVAVIEGDLDVTTPPSWSRWRTRAAR